MFLTFPSREIIFRFGVLSVTPWTVHFTVTLPPTHSDVWFRCRWFQAEAGSTLFHVTKDPLDPTEFEETVDSNGNVVTGWGRSSTIEVTRVQTYTTSSA